MLMLMFKNLASVAKAHSLHRKGSCRESMSKQTLNSFRYFADSLVSYLISSSPGKELSLRGEIDEISQIAFASILMPLHCHKDTIGGNLLLEFEQPLESRTLKDGVLKLIC